MDNNLYIALLALAGISAFLQISWLLLATILIFAALLVSQYSEQRAQSSSYEHTPAEIANSSGPANQAPQPIVVVSGGGGTAATISDQMIATMMGNFMAMDAYEKKDQKPWFSFLSRGMKMRQNMFDHHGKVASHHQGLQREYSDQALARLDKIISKLDKD